MKLSIGKKIGLLVFGTAILSASLVGYGVYNASKALLVIWELQALGQDVQLRGATVVSTIHSLRQDVLFLSKTPPVQGIIRAQTSGGIDPLDGSSEDLWRDRLSVIFTEMLRAKPHYFKVGFIGQSDGGRELVDVRQTEKTIIKTPKEFLLVEGQKSYFRETLYLDDGDVYLSEINLNREYGQVMLPHTPVLRVATPVYDSSGEAFGIIIVTMDFGSALDSLRGHIKGNREIYVTNQAGDFLAHPDPSKAFGFDVGQRYTLQDLYPNLSGLFDDGNNEQEFSGQIKNEIGNEVVRFLKVPYDPQQPERFLGLAIGGPAQAVLTGSHSLLQGSFVLTILAISVATVLGFGLSRRLVRPLHKMKDAMERMARGEYDVSLPGDTTDEVGLLGQSMKVMADRVRKRTEELTREVAVRKEAEKKLLEKDARIEGILETAADGIVTIDEQGIIETFNKAAQQMFGYSLEEAVGQNVSVLMPSPDREQHDGYLFRYHDTGDPRIIGKRREVIGQRQDGTTFPMDLGVSEVRLGTGRVFTGIIRDISDRKQAETERERLHKQLTDSSRRAGMADVASGVLHNVGNILTSVNVSVGVVRKILQQASYEKVQRTAALIHDHLETLGSYLTQDPKGQQIPAYLTQLGDHLAQEQNTVVKEVQELTTNIEHINQVIQTQQTIAKSGGYQEPVLLSDLMDQALMINMASIDRHQIAVVREYLDIPAVVTDRHQVLQILVNLINNAKYAVMATTREDGQMTLTIGWVEGKDGRVKLQVKDNGVGIQSDNLTRIFTQGFSTKKEGHGFGLHSAALSAKNMGGSLIVHSDGEGQGAIFTLELPVTPVVPKETIVTPETHEGQNAQATNA